MKKITEIFPEKWLHMDGFDEKYALEWFEGFMKNREIKNLSELKDYIIYLEDIAYDENINDKSRLIRKNRREAAMAALRLEALVCDFSESGRDLKLKTEKEFNEAMAELTDDLIRNR